MAHSRLNLNLLICLYHILKEQSVSLAARKMFVTQSAMSKSLAQLREKLNDPIIVRNKGRIEITATAKSMQNQVEHIVSSALLFFDNAAFSPKQSRKCFSLLCDDVTMHHFLPPFIHKLSKTAPSISIELIPSTSEALHQLILGKVDLALRFSQENNSRLQSHTLMHDRMVAVMSRTHPLADTELTENSFVDTSVVTLTPEHKQYKDIDCFFSTRFSQKVIAQLPTVTMVLDMLAQTQCLAVLPMMTMRLVDNQDQFVTKELPFNEATTIPLNLLWVSAQDNNLANRWLRQSISTYFNDVNNH